MPRTPLGIFYPDSDDDIQGSIEEMMLSIDTAVSSLQSDIVDLDKTDGVMVYLPSQTIGHAVGTPINFTGGFFQWDSGPYWNAGTPTQFDLTPGWWLISVTGRCRPALGNILQFDFYADSNHSNSICHRSLPNTGTDLGHTSQMGLYCHPGGAVTDYVQLVALFIGSAGGNADITSIWFSAHKIREL